MANLTYSEQLRHPNWQKLRLEVLQRDGWMCQSCYDKETTLHVHHKRYVKGRLAWEYPPDELITLCDPCHSIAHEEGNEIKELIAKLPTDGPCCVADVTALIAGFCAERPGPQLHGYFEKSPYQFALGAVAGCFDLVATEDQLISIISGMARLPLDVQKNKVEQIVNLFKVE